MLDIAETDNIQIYNIQTDNKTQINHDVQMESINKVTFLKSIF